MSFAENLKKIRKSRKLSQQKLADKMNIAQSTVGMWEAGHRTPKLDEINRLAVALSTTIERLVGKQQKLEIIKGELYVDGEKVENIDSTDIEELLRHIMELKSAKKQKEDLPPKKKGPAGKKILIIDDEQEMCELLYSFLVPHNYKVFLTFNGQMGLEYFQEIKPDVVLLDLTMPDIDGIEVLRIIRKVSDVPVLIITAHPENIADIHLEALSITGYIEKPFSIGQILNILKHLLGE